MREIILIKNGELALKGLNRVVFEDALVKNIRATLKPLGNVQIKKAQSTITIEPTDENYDFDEAANRVSKVFGIAAYSRCAVADKDINDIFSKTIEFLGEELSNAKTFKVNAKRADKTFSMKSPEICHAVGGHILKNFNHLKVDVHNPEVTVTVEVRDHGSYIHASQLPGAGGMPVGTGGNAAILISGGIDSPVAAYMIAKRGIRLTAVHFASPPYTSKRAENKVKTLLTKVALYSGFINYASVPFTKIQEEIAKKCPEDLMTIIMRRFMMKISCIIAIRNKCNGLITGESIGQVASQTMGALLCTDHASSLPVYRPVIGLDKEEIVEIARKIDTFETSILPYEDCCTVFTPKHPRTKPILEKVIEAENLLDVDALIEEAVAGTRFCKIDSERTEF